MSEVILQVENLVKKYGSFRAVGGISFSVPRGKVVGLLGPNGAGKTTTIQILLGVTLKNGGMIKYWIFPTFDESRMSRQRELFLKCTKETRFQRKPDFLLVPHTRYHSVSRPRFFGEKRLTEEKKGRKASKECRDDRCHPFSHLPIEFIGCLASCAGSGSHFQSTVLKPLGLSPMQNALA